jgi:hypothetical protein
MATVITWTIRRMTCAPAEAGQTDVVVTANWTCQGVDQSTAAPITASRAGTCTFTYTGGGFTPYDQLTESQVLGWCWSSGVDKTGTEAAVTQQIQEQAAAPVTISQPLPWAA